MSKDKMIQKNMNEEFKYYYQLAGKLRNINWIIVKTVLSCSQPGSELMVERKVLVRETRSLQRKLKSACWRCYGTGRMMALQMDLDFIPYSCDECGRTNINGLEL